MAVELDVFVGNTTIMDEEVYQLWLDGYTVNDAVKVRMEGGVMEECEASADVLLSDTMDQYRTFQMCERLLHSPAKLANQLLFQIPPHRQVILIERYYTFDDSFVREVLGKKLSKGTKKDLDDISAKTGVTLKSCRRQFDNFKRVFKVVEELKGPLVENIRQHFLLSDKLARDYAAIVFFANNRFETGKRKLQYLTFQDFAFCAGQLINNWTVGAVDNMVEDMDVDLDKEFLQELKELKVLINDKDLLDQHKSLVCTALRGKTKAFTEMEANFKNLSRGLVNIAAKLTNTKDVRDFFIDLVEKFIEPCRSDRWTAADMRLYLTHYTNSAHILDTFNLLSVCLSVFWPSDIRLCGTDTWASSKAVSSKCIMTEAFSLCRFFPCFVFCLFHPAEAFLLAPPFVLSLFRLISGDEFCLLSPIIAFSLPVCNPSGPEVSVNPVCK
ncbi:fibroblast growth factor (acidic) intracellular binding protein a isoform X1 [Micropterus salmoides]|uniref:fibroblast growth factor (acidic) intracellular binding protein a isoform X1 n=1 Tax=Micropterus salmoides TaxID=27706 RepID=UPI0018EB3B94|nr:fibroblast growth factor (acidic) intracellular binding protein a isoform X1 [Micropterus salmoides]XP_038555471.1 fibroblast growth factor (acidic) intracellular binding protein a isoform X1 [Micropterus salmoides]